MVEQIRSAILCFEAQLAVNQWVISSSLISGAKIFWMTVSTNDFYISHATLLKVEHPFSAWLI